MAGDREAGAFLLQPGIYSTHGHSTLSDMLDVIWASRPGPEAGGGTLYVLSGFATHNGGVPYFERFRHYIENGGQVKVALAGSKNSNTASRQLAAALLDAGVEVTIVQRRDLMHAKLYGYSAADGEQALVVTSGNFTTPGTKLNIEAAILLGSRSLENLTFSWAKLWTDLQNAGFDNSFVLTDDHADPVWELLFDEEARRARPGEVEVDEDADADQFGSMIFTLSHADTARIQAARGTAAGSGSQYFWLSKDSYDFFPPLMIRNKRGVRATYSTMVDVEFVDVGRTDNVRVTFEAENNLDFRLGTGPLRHTKVAARGDLAVLTRRDETRYELRIIKRGTPKFHALRRYATTQVGQQGKVAGFTSNAEVDRILAR